MQKQIKTGNWWEELTGCRNFRWSGQEDFTEDLETGTQKRHRNWDLNKKDPASGGKHSKTEKTGAGAKAPRHVHRMKAVGTEAMSAFISPPPESTSGSQFTSYQE